jgi:dihydrodipicolinate synthase/N-acetylneuraminate lyase
MGWSVLIAALVEVLGPLVADWLKSCGEDRAKRAAERLPAFESFASEDAARDALFDEVIADLPRLAFARRGLLRRLKATAAKAGVTSAGAARPLDPEDAADLADLAAAADQE